MSTVREPAPPSTAADFLIPVPTLDNRPRIGRQRSSFRAPAQVPSRPALAPRHGGLKRRLLGLGLLSCVVVLWTVSGFLQSSIYADNTYSKPYFVTYLNTAFFALPLIPYLLKRYIPTSTITRYLPSSILNRRFIRYERVEDSDAEEPDLGFPTARDTLRGAEFPRSYDSTQQRRGSLCLTQVSTGSKSLRTHSHTPLPPLTTKETFYLSIRFAFLWFIANYFNAACLHYTTVASLTIISTTASVFTLLFGALSGVETFSFKKLFGVLACLGGVALISSVDIKGGQNDEDRGTFPAKTPREIAIGDALALASAMLYGLYCVMMVKTIGDESRVKMPVFFGFLGLVNILCLWPGFFLLQATGIETFEFPPTSRIWMVVLVNAASSLISDLCWAYAMLFTSPLVVTVGLSLTIPLSLVGQILIDGQYSSPIYWFGASVVVLSFVFINHESAVSEKPKVDDGEDEE